MSTDALTRWSAWTRTPPSRTWVRVADGASEAEARAAVFDVPPTGPFRDICVLPVNVDPNRRIRL